MSDRQAPIRRNPREVHDFWPRVLASPFLGALVVNLSGLIDHARHSTAGVVASYAWFALVAFAVWEGNRRLYFLLPRREDWLLRPWSRLGVLLALISLYTIPVSLALLWSWRAVTGDPGTRHYALTTAIFAVVAFVVAITHVYETVFLLRDWESDRMRSARLEQARLQTELESLGREVDPHFLFNNLNALAHLVDQRSDAAAGFIRTLSASYRYVLECRGRALVPLADELDALERHRALADIRYGGGVRLAVDVQAADAQQLSLPPVSLAELFQNALKHNSAGPDLHLHIRVRVDDATLVFENDLRPGPKGGAFDRDRSREPARAISHRHRASGRMDRRGGSLRRPAAARAKWELVLVAVTAACLQCLVPDLETLFLDAGGVLVFPNWTRVSETLGQPRYRRIRRYARSRRTKGQIRHRPGDSRRQHHRRATRVVVHGAGARERRRRVGRSHGGSARGAPRLPCGTQPLGIRAH